MTPNAVRAHRHPLYPSAGAAGSNKVVGKPGTGGAIQLLEVDYPNASFGSNALAAGATYRYRIQLQGSGPLKVQFTASDGKQAQIGGPTVSEGQEGRLEIVLLPGGKAEFHPQLTAKP